MLILNYICISLRYKGNSNKDDLFTTTMIFTQTFNFQRLSFLFSPLPVIRAKVKEVKTKCHDVTAVVEVKEILKSSLVNIPRDTVNLYTNSGCLCPPLSANEEYIIMGYEDEERSR